MTNAGVVATSTDAKFLHDRIDMVQELTAQWLADMLCKPGESKAEKKADVLESFKAGDAIIRRHLKQP